MKLSISEAAKLAGKNRKTIYAHIANGKLSASTDETGLKTVDVSELERVYGNLRQKDSTIDSKQDSDESETGQLVTRIQDLERQLETEQERRLQAEEEKKRLFDMLENALRQLPAPSVSETGQTVTQHKTPPKNWLQRLFRL